MVMNTAGARPAQQWRCRVLADKMDNPRVKPLSHDGRAPSLAYNSALDGLRGVAILLVILSHAHAPRFDGAFSGVELFFVLSGFLITSLLLQELGGTGRIQYWRFYRRRFYRLMPALLFFLAAYCLLAPRLWLRIKRGVPPITPALPGWQAAIGGLMICGILMAVVSTPRSLPASPCAVLGNTCVIRARSMDMKAP